MNSGFQIIDSPELIIDGIVDQSRLNASSIQNWIVNNYVADGANTIGQIVMAAVGNHGAGSPYPNAFTLVSGSNLFPASICEHYLANQDGTRYTYSIQWSGSLPGTWKNLSPCATGIFQESVGHPVGIWVRVS
jgi:hypothetical protein